MFSLVLKQTPPLLQYVLKFILVLVCVFFSFSFFGGAAARVIVPAAYFSIDKVVWLLTPLKCC